MPTFTSLIYSPTDILIPYQKKFNTKEKKQKKKKQRKKKKHKKKNTTNMSAVNFSQKDCFSILSYILLRQHQRQ